VPERNTVELVQPVEADVQLTAVRRALAGAPSAFGFRGEKSLLFAGAKTKWKIWNGAIVWWWLLRSMIRKMSNDKLRAVKREAASGLRPSREAGAVTPRPVNEPMDGPRRLSDRFRSHSDRRKIETDDVVLETFTLPLEAARLKVRSLIDGISQPGYREIVERWRQLPNGEIEFTVRHVQVAD
jgi:hypothetical protein